MLQSRILLSLYFLKDIDDKKYKKGGDNGGRAAGDIQLKGDKNGEGRYNSAYEYRNDEHTNNTSCYE